MNPSFPLISALLRGGWLVDERYARQHLPFVRSLLEGTGAYGMFAPAAKEIVTEGISQIANIFNPNAAANEISYLSSNTFAARPGGDFSAAKEGAVAVVNLIGPVLKYGGMCSTGTTHLVTLLQQLDAADNVPAIILNVDSPGGQAAGTAALFAQIAGMKKPVVGWVNDGDAASAAMWAISGCREIYASNKLSAFGSIGAYCRLEDDSEADAASGIKVHYIYAPQSTDKNKAYLDAFAGDYAGIQAELYELVEAFKEDVQTGRGGKVKEEAFTGKMYNAKEAIKMGLADGIKSFDEVVARALELSKKTNSKTKTDMSKGKTYSHLAKTAGWEKGHEATEEGVHLTHEDCAKVDAALQAGELAQTALTEAQNTKDSLATDLQTTKDSLATAQADAASWKAKAEEYGKGAANTGTTVVTTEDKPAEQPVAGKVHPYTQQAMDFAARLKR